MNERLRARTRAAVAAAPGRHFEDESALDHIVDELAPFVDTIEASRRITSEVSSYVWLFGYRMGDRGVSAMALVAALAAWREESALPDARALADTVNALALDGYTRGREERHLADLRRRLGESLLVAEAAPGVVFVVAAGPLDPDAATSISERAGQLMLRCDARAVLLDWSALDDATEAVRAALWTITGSARMLGAHAVVVGRPSADDARADADAWVIRAPTLARGVEALVRDCGVSLAGGGLLAWAKGLVKGARAKPTRSGR